MIYDEQGQRIYVLEKLLQKRQYRKKTQFLCKWLGLPDSENSWEYVDRIRHVSHWDQLLSEYQAQLQPGGM